MVVCRFVFKLLQVQALGFLLLPCFCFSHTFPPCLKQNKCLIFTPVLNLHQSPNETSSLVSQGIYGHSLYIIKRVNAQWALVETEDGYQGYALLKNLTSDSALYRTSKKLRSIASVAGRIYPVANMKQPAILSLPFGALIEIIEDQNSTSPEDWEQVRLIDGAKGWMQKNDLEKIETKTLKKIIRLSKRFLERPYIWGGSSSEGFDCSGYIQTLYRQTGIILPRDSPDQARSYKVISFEKPEQPGDLLFFGINTITHVGMYLGNDRFIHTAFYEKQTQVGISNLKTFTCPLLAVKRVKKASFYAKIFPITEKIKSKMQYSWKDQNPVPLADLRYIQLNHWGFDKCVYNGELIVHKLVADEIVAIFHELFNLQYPIEKMLLIDKYSGDDDLSCEDNNSSAFCSRKETNTNQWSEHSFGLAVDINPLLNPYYNPAWRKKEKVIGGQFLDRTLDCYGLITEQDACYKAFTSRGWKWGGHWEKEKGFVDYQHFYKEKLPLKKN